MPTTNEANGTRKLLTIKEAAERLSMGVPTLYTWVLQGKITHVKLGRSVRFRPEDLDDLVQKNVKVAAA